MECNQVQDGLQNALSTRAPDPVAVSKQYRAAFGDEDEEDPVRRSTCASTGFSRGAFLSFLKGPRADASHSRGRLQFKRPAKASSSEGTEGYTPHIYAEKRKAFLLEAQQKGLGAGEARAAWNESREKALLLCDVSIPELKRRKFVPKGCTENPFQVMIRGA